MAKSNKESTPEKLGRMASKVSGAAKAAAGAASRRAGAGATSKDLDLEPFRRSLEGTSMTTDHGLKVAHTDDSLKAGARGPILLEDHHLREKITHFDHERIPERVVHARGSAAHGFFQAYEPVPECRAAFLQDPKVKTPVFVRFSTVVGSRGSADTVRDVRGFATRFYTTEGNFDLVGNNIPVFFIQDGIKFPDLVHAAKPEPHHEIPGASTAHDTFWDFAGLMPESTHMLLWILSDRAIPRSFGHMEGFGVHTFKLVDAEGVSRFVKFHWKPMLGVHSLVWDEAQKLAGKDPDFHRRELWEAITSGNFPEFELGLQIVEEREAESLGIDLLDATKIIPEELVPVRKVGKMTLDRNPDNFFAETEQVAFHLGNIVPGIDFTNDPLLQVRLFSYIDTQLTRLGGPNFAELPINRPIAPVANHQQDGFARQKIVQGRVNYFPNSLANGCPMMNPEAMGGFVTRPEPVSGPKTRERSPTFADHFSQAKLFWASLSVPERLHLIEAGRFELGKVETKAVRERVIANFAQVDRELAEGIASGIGVMVPEGGPPAAPPAKRKGRGPAPLTTSPALSQANTVMDTVKGRRVAALVADGYAHAELERVRSALQGAGARLEVIAPVLGEIAGAGGSVEADKTFLTGASVFYDAVYVPGGAGSIEKLSGSADAIHFVNEAFRHCKAVGATGEGLELLRASDLRKAEVQGLDGMELSSDAGVVVQGKAGKLGPFTEAFIAAVAQHRHWDRGEKSVPA